jgi:hypothetical protein
VTGTAPRFLHANQATSGLIRPAACAASGEGEESPPMAASVPRREEARPGPGRLPAIERNLRTERAKRHERLGQERKRRATRRRFLALLLLLVAAAVFLGLTILDQIRSLFGI